jgi:hypothetical protein
MKTSIALLTASLGAALLAVPAAATPIASQAHTGTINLNFQSGLSVIGNLNAQYRTPGGSPRPYQFNTSLDFGAVNITPSISVTTPEFVLIPGTTVCVPFLGCITTPDVTVPSQTIPLNPTIALTSPVNVYNLSYTSPVLPLGQLFTFDFGTPILGQPQTINNLVQEQFETGATTVNETGSLGPFTGTYEYEGVLQPSGDTILAEYMLNITGPGLLADLENALLEIINENTGLLASLALEALKATDPCGGLTVGQDVCEDFLAGLDGDDLQIAVLGIGNFSTDYTWLRSIEPVPVPATLPLLALGVVLVGLTSRRRRKDSAA